MCEWVRTQTVLVLGVVLTKSIGPIPPNIAQYPNASIVLTLAMETKVPQFKTENPHLTAYITEPI